MAKAKKNTKKASKKSTKAPSAPATPVTGDEKLARLLAVTGGENPAVPPIPELTDEQLDRARMDAPPAIEPETFNLVTNEPEIPETPEPEIKPDVIPAPSAPVVTVTEVSTPEHAESLDAPEIVIDPEVAASLRACLVIYDIPNDSEMSNPTWLFRRLGFRVNLSCWVVPEGAIPHRFIWEMRNTYGATVDIVRFDAAEGPRLVRMAIASMQKEVTEQSKRTAKAIEDAATRHLPEGESSPEERDATHERYLTAAKNGLGRLREVLRDVELAIQQFGMTPAALGLTDARSAYTAYQTGIQKRGEAYVRATNALRAAATETTNALADAADADAVPAGVMADALRDAGNDEAADDLARAFDLPGAEVEIS